MMNSGLYTSNREDWETPRTLIADLSEVFDWDLDVCASRGNVCKNFYYENGLSLSWAGLCWMNPPYGKQIGKWMDKASENNVICLVPARTDTRWWHRNIHKASLVVFIKGRLKFGNQKGSAPFPSAFVVFGDITDKQKDKLNSYGWAAQ